jgi:hypothetical protein
MFFQIRVISYKRLREFSKKHADCRYALNKGELEK